MPRIQSQTSQHRKNHESRSNKKTVGVIIDFEEAIIEFKAAITNTLRTSNKIAVSKAIESNENTTTENTIMRKTSLDRASKRKEMVEYRSIPITQSEQRKKSFRVMLQDKRIKKHLQK